MKLQADFTFPPDPEKPDVIITETSSDFLRWCDKEGAGEVVIETAEIVTRHAGWWKLRLRWP